MTPNGVASLFSRLTYLWPDARPLEKDQDLFETWLMALKPVEDDEVFEALPTLAQQTARRPSMAEIVQAAKAVRNSRMAPLALPENRKAVPLTIRQQVRTTLGMRPPEDAA